jgi:Putative peptidoglycan binding domain
MKTKFYWFALLASAALIAQAQASGYHTSGVSIAGGGGHISSPAYAAAPSFHPMSPANLSGGGRFVAPGQRFSAIGGRLSSNAFRQHYINSGAAIGTRQFTPGHFNRGNYVTRFANRGNRPGRIANPAGERTGIQNQAGGDGLTRFGNNRHDRLGQPGNRVGKHNGAGRSHGSQVRNGNNLPPNWQNHVAGQRSASWHRDWDRNRDHFWNGHRCRFVDGSWFIFDLGFFPWYPYGYPYDYYAYDYYPYQYDSGVYEGDDGDYYGQGAYESPDEYADSTVSAAQAQLSRQGYYRGKIDGVYGAATRRAVIRYQGDHGLRVTGSLNTDTLQALRLPRVANN